MPKTLGREWTKRPLYVPLFASFPILSIFSANLALLPLSDLWRPLFVTILAALVIWGVCSLIWRNASRGAASAVVIVLLLFAYRVIVDHAPMPYLNLQMPFWAAITLLGAALAGWKVTKADYALNMIGAFLILFSVGTILVKYAVMISHRAVVAREKAGILPEKPPDIVYVILDGYGREDALHRVMGLDNSEFLNALRDRGFYVADHSHSNYVQTELSLSSSLNMAWIPDLLPKIAKDETDRSPLDGLVDNNRLSRFLKARGYEYTVISTGFPAFHFVSADLHLETVSSASLFEDTLVAMTPFGESQELLGSQFDERRRTLATAAKNLGEMARQTAAPKFVFVHFLAPHPPFVFNADLTAAPRHGGFGFWDGSDFEENGMTKAQYREGYRGQIQAVNKLILPQIDALINRSGVKPIIVIQGDHGSKLNLNQNSLAKTDVNEAFPNLAAIYAPPEIRERLYPQLYAGLTPVNEFRIILSTMFGANLPNLPDRSWYSGFEHPYHFTEITSQLK